jgi:3-hydroxyisobutyrate dehydrogenase-like beta-hydroxyacid dehydrogenase
MTAQQGPVSMVGVGNMGGRMARRMTEAGDLAGGVRVADNGAGQGEG